MSRLWMMGVAAAVAVALGAVWLGSQEEKGHATPQPKPAAERAEKDRSAARLVERLRALRERPRDASEERENAEEERGEAHAQRARWVRRMYEDDEGNIPTNALMRAKPAFDQLRKRSGTNRRTAGVDAGSWTELGPSRIGGRVRAIAVHPDAADTVWLGGVSGGLWKSVNKGQHWEPVDGFLSNLAISSIAIKPTDSNVMWVATGEFFTGGGEPGLSPGHGALGAGVFRSTDGGVTWSQLAPTASWPFVNRLAVSPDGTTLLAAVVEIAPNDDFPLGSGRLWESADDGGSWTPVSADTFPGTGIFGDVDFHPTDSNRAIAGITHFGGQATYGPIVYTTNGGASWQTADLLSTLGGGGGVTDQVMRVETCWAQDGSNTAYASVAVRRNGTSIATGGLFRSTNGGENWTVRNRSMFAPGGQVGDGTYSIGQIGLYANTVWVSPPIESNGEIVIGGGISLHRSTDGGTNFSRITNHFDSAEWGESHDNEGTSVHADHHILVAHPRFDGVKFDEVYMGNDGGVYLCENPLTAGQNGGTPDWGPGFTRINNNLRISQFYAGDIIGEPHHELFAGGTQDNGTLVFINDTAPGSIDMDRDWFSAFPGDGGISAWDPENVNYLYGSLHRGNFTRRDGGVPFMPNLVDHGVDEFDLDGKTGSATTSRTPPHAIPDSWDDTPFIPTAMDLDPEDPETLWIGLESVWRTRDARTPIHLAGPNDGPEWLNALPSDSDTFGYVTVIKVDPTHPRNVWVGFDGGALFKSTNGRSASPTFTRIGPVVNEADVSHGVLTWPTRRLSGIAIDPNNGNHVVVCFGGFTSGNVWATWNGGSSWTRMDSMPQVPAFDVEIHPFQSNSLYVGTEFGVVASNDHGDSWTSTPEGHDGPVATRVTELMWLEDYLYAATYGRGLFRIRVTQPSSFYLDPSLINRVPWPVRGALEPAELVIANPRPGFSFGPARTWVWSTGPRDAGQAGRRHGRGARSSVARAAR